MKFKNQFGKREETSDGCLTQVETSKIKRDREESKTEKKNHQKLFRGELFFLTFDQASLKQKGMKDRLIAG